jgi:hypothetical protein
MWRQIVSMTAGAVTICVVCFSSFAADLPVREVILYKHGVGYFTRSGELKPGETARLGFKADDMNDVLKSLTVTDRDGGKVSSVRYDASEPLNKRLEDFPFSTGTESTLAAFLDQMKGARIELKLGNETVAGAILGARVAKGGDKDAERQTVTLFGDAGEIRTFDLAAASSLRFADLKLQGQLKDYLAVLGQANSKDRRSIYIDSIGSAARDLIARYTIPSPVWKSSYRLVFGTEGPPMLEGWAIVDNTSGEDWTAVRLSVVSGKPISFITQLYPPRYVTRPEIELAENKAVAPVVFQAAMGMVDKADSFTPRPSPPAKAAGRAAGGGGVGGGTYRPSPPVESSVAATAEGSDAGELFEYSFAGPVTVKKGESAMLPFLQQKIDTRKLLIYSENFGLNPMNAAEITNNTGKTLDGGPITVYDANTYAGEALVETVKAGDKRLISYGVDLGTRVTTKFDSTRDVVREIHFRRGVLSARSAVEETKTYTIHNVDAKAKTLIIEHAQRYGYKLLSQKPAETTANAYRFEVKLAPSATQTFAVREERLIDQTYQLTSMTPDVLATWVQNKTLTDAQRRELEQIAQKKREIAENEASVKSVDNDIIDLTQDQTRVRSNIQSLNNVSGQQELVQQYARQLASAETKLATLRDTQAQLRRAHATLESDLNMLMERIDF